MAKPNPFSDDEIKELKRGRGISPLGIITTNRFLDTIAELQSTVDFWDKVSERHHSKYIKLGKIWAKAVGKEGTIPDTGKLLDWLVERIAELENRIKEFEENSLLQVDKDGTVHQIRCENCERLEGALDEIEKLCPNPIGVPIPNRQFKIVMIINLTREVREGGKKVDRKAD